MHLSYKKLPRPFSESRMQKRSSVPVDRRKMPTSIAELGEDILWEIFLMNADLDAVLDLGGLYEPGKEPPRSWRNLILGSPSIWGRVIHLDFFDQVKGHWREEVMRRTGDAPLCLKGEITVPRTEDFFLDLLETEWHRIRKIDVRLYTEYVFEDDVWSPLLLPAPSLESFNLGYSYYRSLSIPKGRLFSNNAPLLREFRATGIPFDVNSRWVQQLRHITLSAPFSVPEILRILKEMQFLTSIDLQLGIRAGGEITNEIQDVALPRLRNIVLTTHLMTGLKILESISPASGCGLTMVSHSTRDALMSQVELDRAVSVFARFSCNYFAVYPPKRLALGLTSQSFSIYDLLDSFRLPSSPSFKFAVQLHQSLAWEANRQLIRSLMHSPLTSLHLMELVLAQNAVEICGDEFLKLTQSMLGLGVLQTDTLDLLPPLCQMPSTFPIPFPALHTLKIVTSTKISSYLIEMFLSWRQKCEKPIEVLDLTFSSVSLLGNLSNLNSFKGMRIRWSQQFEAHEYVCGIGTGKRLIFGRFEDDI
ncbi:hypothetical protein CVT26_001582 [Gymnopilus dilepis]|uniref:F-box domain-containing protein n=1 Tax=Gymnopilus dilepis TaxID=231916 RepID=A0A409VTL5_9AGAR|nr:hypothetical protein CVT26_001582 [Gymnopilus dilepis]